MAGEGGWDEAGAAGFGDRRLKNTLPLYGNKDTMNLNTMILTNVLGSPYFKEELIAYKTFHEVVDEIYFKVDHLEPWEKNSRKLAGQVGMCAGVRGVAAGGIVSTAFCLLFKLFTFKLTRKQVTAMMNHSDSPYIRGIGFMYVRYTQPPQDFWDWFSPYLEDEEEIDLKAGGGYAVTVGEMCTMMISKLDWFGTLFPRLPVHVQKNLEARLQEIKDSFRANRQQKETNGYNADSHEGGRDAGRNSIKSSPVRRRSRSCSRERRLSPSRDEKSPPRGRRRSRSRDRHARSPRERPSQLASRSRDRPSPRERRGSWDKRTRSRSRERPSRPRSRDRRQSRSRDRAQTNNSTGRRSRSRDRRQSRSRDRAQTNNSTGRRSRSRERGRPRSRSRERKRSYSPVRRR